MLVLSNTIANGGGGSTARVVSSRIRVMLRMPVRDDCAGFPRKGLTQVLRSSEVRTVDRKGNMVY